MLSHRAQGGAARHPRNHLPSIRFSAAVDSYCTSKATQLVYCMSCSSSELSTECAAVRVNMSAMAMEMERERETSDREWSD